MYIIQLLRDSLSDCESCPMPTDKKRLGQIGEDLAARYLAGLGYTVIARNFRAHLPGMSCCPSRPGRVIAELDIVAADADTLVFVEVKTRRSQRWGSPLESITPAKMAKLRLAAQVYLSLSKVDYTNIRFDALSLLLQAEGWKITHFKDIG